MTIRYLLDTNIISALIKDPAGAAQKRVAQLPENCIASNLVVFGEIRFGVAKKQSLRLAAQAEAILNAITILPIETPVDREYAEIRADLERKGRPIGANDLWIAAHARANGLVLVTDNVGEFSRVLDLRIENWLVD